MWHLRKKCHGIVTSWCPLQVSRSTNGRVSVTSQCRRVEWLESRPTEGGFNASTSSTVLARLNYLNFSFLFLLPKNMCTSLWFFFCFPFSFFFLMVCALAWFTGVDRVMLLCSLAQQGCEGGKAMLGTKGWVLTCWAAPAACWSSSAHGLSAGRFTLLTEGIRFGC